MRLLSKKKLQGAASLRVIQSGHASVASSACLTCKHRDTQLRLPHPSGPAFHQQHCVICHRRGQFKHAINRFSGDLRRRCERCRADKALSAQKTISKSNRAKRTGMQRATA